MLSDLHYGHNINESSNITNNLRLYFTANHKLFKELDTIYISGDTYHGLLNQGSVSNKDATTGISYLITYCSTNDIKIRFLEGTPSHDMKQLGNITTMIKNLNVTVDYKYIDTLMIEHDATSGLNILYLPDEWNDTADKTSKDIAILLRSKKLATVDIVIMHGQFHYQLPMYKSNTSHSEEMFINMTKYHIHPGHIHTHSIFKKIIAPGSFDRLAHNEEGAKGGLYCTITKTGGEYMFIENVNAKIFKTVQCKSIPIEQLKAYIYNSTKTLPPGSCVRVKLDKSDKNVKQAVIDITSTVKIYRWKIEYNENKNMDVVTMINTNVNPLDSFHITKSNIVKLMEDELEDVSLTIRSVAIAELSKVI